MQCWLDGVAEMTNPVVQTLGCGCTYTTDGQRHWCPSCTDALGGYTGGPCHRTPLCVAAPELLAACEAALPAIGWGLCHRPGNMNQWRDVDAQLQAAIAKAKDGK